MAGGECGGENIGEWEGEYGGEWRGARIMMSISANGVAGLCGGRPNRNNSSNQISIFQKYYPNFH